MFGAAGHHRAIKPHPTSSVVPGGLHRDDFVVDEDAGAVTCPQGHVVMNSLRLHASFAQYCAHRTLRPRCTNAKGGRRLHLTTHDAEFVESRRAWREGDFISDYRKYRLMLESSIPRLVKGHCRRVGFRGVEKI